MGFELSDVANASIRVMNQLDAIAHNLANASTSGFKSEHLLYAISSTNERGKVSKSSALAPMLYFGEAKVIDWSQGRLERTDNNLDAAIEGDGYFAIQQGDNITYTRNGSFVLNKSNQLVTKSGAKVMGDSGPITINGSKISIDNDGTINVDGNTAGKLKITAFANKNNLKSIGEGQYTDEGNAGLTKAGNCRIVGGYLESSNINVMKEMVEMIDRYRSFESYQKMILTLSDMDKISTNRIGRLT